jgi:anti-anti-sigma factor
MERTAAPDAFQIRLLHTTCWVVEASGEIDLSAAPQLTSLVRLLEVMDGDVDVDLSEVTFMDSAGWDAMRAMLTTLRGEGRRVSVLRVSEAVARVDRLMSTIPTAQVTAGRPVRP